MGNLIHVAEVAVLLFAAYSVGWLGGYVLRRATAASRKPAQIPAERLAAVTGQAVDPDALVKAPVIVEVSKGSPEMVVAPAAVTISAIEAVNVGAAQTVSSASPTLKPLSAIEALKSLSQTIPLLPVEASSVPAPPGTSQADLPVSFGPLTDLPEASVVIGTLAASPATPTPEVSVEALSTAAPLTVSTVEARPSESKAPQGPASAERPAMSEAVEPPLPAFVAGQAWAGRRHGQGSPMGREPEVAVRTVDAASDATPDAASRAESAVGAALLATLEARLAIEAALAGPPKATHQPALTEVLPVTADLSLAAEPATPPTAGEPISFASPTDADALASPQTEEPDSAVVPQQSLVNAVAGGPQLEAQSAPTPDLAELPDSLATAVAAALAPQTAAVVEPISVAPMSTAPTRQVTPQQVDEGAAMRAIEGGWSRRDTRALSDIPELSDVTAAVSAAQVAVENVLAQSLDSDGPLAGLGKPSGLPRARDGVRDDLKKINGLSPLDESTLNNMGIYHFDQIAAWQQTEVLWLENHVFARGRIGREDWQGQARAIAARGALRATR